MAKQDTYCETIMKNQAIYVSDLKQLLLSLCDDSHMLHHNAEELS